MDGGATVTSRSAERSYKLPTVAQRAAYVERNFNEIAAHYDRFNDLATFGLHRLWKRRTVKSILPRTAGPVALLDLCAGTGDLSLLACRLAPGDSRVVAADFSEGMLDVLRERARAESGGVTLEVRRADATRLVDFADGSFDGVMIGFGLRNVDNRAACETEAYRVLRPGGRLAILDVGRVTLPVVRSVHRLFFERVVPRLGQWLHGQAHEMYTYLPASARVYPAPRELSRELEHAGFAEVSYRNFLFGSVTLHIARK